MRTIKAGAIRNLFLITITFTVALCSIVYELVFSQVLTVVFGSTVLRYSITIGLFLFSLGLGSFLYDKKLRTLKSSTSTFFYIEILLAISGFLGSFGILLASATLGEHLPHIVLVIISYIPVVIIGILSGIEIPILTQLSDGRFAKILSIDYFGSLCGTVVYALFLYPHVGLVATGSVVALLNALVAVLFMLHFKLFKRQLRYAYTALILIVISLGFFFHTSMEAWARDSYLSRMIIKEYADLTIPITDLTILHDFTTPYQHVSLYKRYLEDPEYNPPDTCLNLDEHVQMCDSWYEAYHHGLVDVPMSMLSERSGLTVLLIGGGDFIPVHFLSLFDANIASIDMVDLDVQFRNYAKTETYLLEKNKHAFKYSKLNIITDDALHYLAQDNTKQYDLILVDLPGLKHDKLLPLYSTEFYTLVRSALNDTGLMASWQYRHTFYPTHTRILEETLSEAGFDKKFNYFAYNVFPNGHIEETEDFFVVAKTSTNTPPITRTFSDYTDRFGDTYDALSWQTITPDDSISANSIFKPNYAMMVKQKER